MEILIGLIAVGVFLAVRSNGANAGSGGSTALAPPPDSAGGLAQVPPKKEGNTGSAIIAVVGTIATVGAVVAKVAPLLATGLAAVMPYLATIATVCAVVFAIIVIVAIVAFGAIQIISDVERKHWVAGGGPARDYRDRMQKTHDKVLEQILQQPEYATRPRAEVERGLWPFVEGVIFELDNAQYRIGMMMPAPVAGWPGLPNLAAAKMNKAAPARARDNKAYGIFATDYRADLQGLDTAKSLWPVSGPTKVAVIWSDGHRLDRNAQTYQNLTYTQWPPGFAESYCPAGERAISFEPYTEHYTPPIVPMALTPKAVPVAGGKAGLTAADKADARADARAALKAKALPPPPTPVKWEVWADPKAAEQFAQGRVGGNLIHYSQYMKAEAFKSMPPLARAQQGLKWGAFTADSIGPAGELVYKGQSFGWQDLAGGGK